MSLGLSDFKDAVGFASGFYLETERIKSASRANTATQSNAVEDYPRVANGENSDGKTLVDSKAGGLGGLSNTMILGALLLISAAGLAYAVSRK